MPRKATKTLESKEDKRIEVNKETKKKVTASKTTSVKKAVKTKEKTVVAKPSGIKKKNVKVSLNSTRSTVSKKEPNKKVTKTSNQLTTSKASTAKKTTAIKTVKKASKVAKKTTAKASATKKTADTRTVKKASKVAKKTIAKASATMKIADTKTVKKASKVAKKTTAKASNIKKTNAKKLSKTTKTTITSEYYDLPYHYNQTVVKILAQTPKTIFVYWDISEEDSKNLTQQYGEKFFENTMPFLRVRNNNSGNSFDVDVDDFANGWYIHVEDSKSDYSVELLRKQRPFVEKVINHAVYITSSNVIETPNDHILFDENLFSVFFKNVKTGEVTARDITNMSLLKRIGKIYNIYDLYKRIYRNEDVGEIFDLNNPSSANPTSTFK